MINRAQITRRSADDEVPARTVERDYFLAHIIAAVSNIQEGSGLVFKGGTALRLCYFDDYRYSADELILETEVQPLLRRWPDLPESTKVLVYSLREIAGEKLRCIIQRLQCRDLYDLHLLFEDADVDVEHAAEVFSQKAQHRDINPAGFEASYQARLIEYRRRWEGELGIHVPGAVPHFDEVERQINRHLRRANLI